MKNNQGFTLIELMIVVAIIAILAAIAISQYQDYVIRSQVSEGSSLADGVKTAVGEFYNNYGRWPCGSGCGFPNGDNASLGLASGGSITGTYVSKVLSLGGEIGVFYSNVPPFKANDAINNSILFFSPTTHAGSISWTCKKNSGSPVVLKDKWLPASCR